MTPWKFKFAGHAGMAGGVFEPRETEIIRTCLGRVDIFVNVGANIGYYCAHALSSGKTSIALEPHPDNVGLLLKNLQINQWAAEVYPVACGKAPQILELFGGGTAASLLRGWAGQTASNPHLVPVVRLDDIVGGRFPNQNMLVLIDVEGAELHVLEGAVELLNRNPKPVWIVEICIDEHFATPDGKNPAIKETFAKFFDSGYRAYSIEAGLREIFASEVAAIADSREASALNIGHNFIFTITDLDWLRAGI